MDTFYWGDELLALGFVLVIAGIAWVVFRIWAISDRHMEADIAAHPESSSAFHAHAGKCSHMADVNWKRWKRAGHCCPGCGFNG